jgi:hypothetical protein
VGIFVNGRVRAVLADRLGGLTNPSKDGHFRSYTYEWECIVCKDSFFIGRRFRYDDIRSEGWPNGTQFQSIKTRRIYTLTCPDPLPGFDEVPDEG